MKVELLKYHGKFFIDLDQLLLFLLESSVACTGMPDAQRALQLTYEQIRDQSYKAKEYL